MNKVKVATVGNPAMHIPTFIGAIPGMSAMASMMMKKQMEKLDRLPQNANKSIKNETVLASASVQNRNVCLA